MRVCLFAVLAALLSLSALGQSLRVAPPAASGPPAQLEIERTPTSAAPEAAKSARDDLKSIMNQVRAAEAGRSGPTAANLQMTPPLRSARVTAPADPCKGADVTSWQRCIDAVEAELLLVSMDREKRTEINGLTATLREDLALINKTGDIGAASLQLLMDRLTRLEAALSNLQVSASDTATSVVENIK